MSLDKTNMSSEPTGYYHYRRPTHRQPPPKKKRRWPAWLVLVLLLIGGYFSYRLSGGDFHLRQAKPASDKAAVAAKPVLSAGQAASMSAQINSIISAHPDLDIGVSIEDLNNDQRYRYGVSNPFIAASISKVLTATLFLHEVGLGQQTLDEDVDGYTAQYELQQLIEISDDDAWANLNDLLTHTALSSYARQIGLQNYDPDQNTLTVDDISLLLAKLYKGELLNAADTKLLITYLHDANYDNWIVASVPAGVKVYHKVGFLDDRVHDAAIIDNGKHPYVLVIFTKTDDDSDYDDTEGHQVFAAVTTATVQAFID